MYVLLGEYEKAADHAAEALRYADIPTAVIYSNRGWALRALGRYAEAKAVFAEAHAKQVDYHVIHRNLLAIAYAEGDQAAADREFAWAKGKPTEPIFLEARALMDLADGRRLAEDHARREPANVRAALARFYAAVGDCDIARALMGPPPENALVLAFCGQLAEAEATLAVMMKGDAATDTVVQRVRVPVTAAVIEIQRGNFVAAREKLATARLYERGQVDERWIAYIAGLSYLGEKRGLEAMAEFEKITKHRSILPWSPLYPLAHLGLARAAVVARDTTRARAAYQDLLALWKNADPGFPPLVAANKELASLGGPQ
jgi:tetratricopeptide (TPR) repeat protein